jgi:hypothetical protein
MLSESIEMTMKRDLERRSRPILLPADGKRLRVGCVNTYRDLKDVGEREQLRLPSPLR